jgi:hypothetical protein
MVSAMPAAPRRGPLALAAGLEHVETARGHSPRRGFYFCRVSSAVRAGRRPRALRRASLAQGLRQARQGASSGCPAWIGAAGAASLRDHPAGAPSPLRSVEPRFSSRPVSQTAQQFGCPVRMLIRTRSEANGGFQRQNGRSFCFSIEPMKQITISTAQKCLPQFASFASSAGTDLGEASRRKRFP